MVISTFVLLLALINSADSTLQAYNTTCNTTATDTCAAGQTCKSDGGSPGTTKCLCDATNHFVTNSASAATGCVCDATNHYVANSSANGCVCDASNHYVVNSSANGCVCDATNHYVANSSTNGCVCDASNHYVANSAGTACQCNSANHWTENTAGDCECSTGYTGVSCKAKIDTACTVNADCVDVNAYCSSGKLCACKSQYTASADKTSCVALELDGVCTATGGECASLTNAYCNNAAASAVCACATVFPKNGTACTAKSCTSGATACTDSDPNSECDATNGKVCKCRANYGIFTRGTKALCQPGVGATCTASSGECGNLSGGYCNTAESAVVCACGAIYDVSSASCTPKTCHRGSSTCENADTNSECGSGVCMCKSGMSIGSAGKCVADSAASGLIVSMVTLMGCLLISTLE